MTEINTTQPKSPGKVKLPVEGGVLFRNIIHCTKPALSFFVHTKWVIIVITDYCFKSQEIEFEKKIADLSGYFSTQNTSTDYWDMF